MRALVVSPFLVVLAMAPLHAGGEEFTVDAGRGEVTVFQSENYDPDVPAPLLVLLHGYTGTGDGMNSYFNFENEANDRGWIYAYPTGDNDFLGNNYWNATDFCCNFGDTDIDDSGYLLDLVGELQLQFHIDPRRVYFMGHSNGGFMSYRMACDHSASIAAIASLAGATFEDTDDCEAEHPVHVLQIHGTLDGVISFDDFEPDVGAGHPGAETSVETWAELNGCEVEGDDSADDLDLVIPEGIDDTVVTRYESECAAGGSSELWAIVGAGHSPFWNGNYPEHVFDYFEDHIKNCEAITPLRQVARITAEEPDTGSDFGVALSRYRERLLVGAARDEVDGTPQGAAYVFAGGGRSWTEVTRLTASDGASVDDFGAAVALWQDVALVGAYRDDDDGSTSGSAYVFRADPDPDAGWTEERKLLASDAAAGDRFGFAVALGDGLAWIGAPRADGDGDDGDLDDVGAVYLFRHDGAGWNQEQVLAASEPVDGAEFGSAVASDGQWLAISAPGEGAGAVYLFSWDDDDGSWTESAVLTPDDGIDGDAFGSSLALADGVLVAGAPDHGDEPDETGAAYVFHLSDEDEWLQETKLTAADAERRDHFGSAVALADDRLAVCAVDADQGLGNTDLFSWEADEWQATDVLRAVNRTTDGESGSAATFAGATLVVGAPAASIVGVSECGRLAVYSMADCNDNEIADHCDLAAEDSEDCNGNGIPDECEDVSLQLLLSAATREVCVGDDLELGVHGFGAVEVDVQWFVDGEELAGATDAVLRVKSVDDADAGHYSVRVTGACDEVTSGDVEVTVLTSCESPERFKRGDANGDGSVSGLNDGTFLLRYGFVEGPAPPCEDAADVDDDGRIVVLEDALQLLRWAFVEGPPPADPGPDECGADADPDDSLDCAGVAAACQ